jgi:GT2 family glycosyltransferase
MTGWPSISIVQVAYNRRDAVRTTLHEMLERTEYPGELEAIVVDNASSDGTTEMLREEFPQVRLIARDENIGAPAWNDGFAVASGDWVLILDDDCYLPPDGLTNAMQAAAEARADMVSFRVVSTVDPTWVFTEKYRTGLFMFWGCACLVRTSAIRELGGYDPELFMWANELELTLRFYDRGYRHLHLPEVTALHMKAPGAGDESIDIRGYRINAKHWAYIAAKLMQPRDAAAALVTFVVRILRDAARADAATLPALLDTARGARRGLQLRRPVRPEVSRFYRENFETFAPPWALSRPPGELLRALPRELAAGRVRKERRPRGMGRREQYFEERAELYPLSGRGVLQL